MVKDLSAAIMWYEKAAKKGDVYSQYALGMFYKKGFVVKKDEQKAME